MNYEKVFKQALKELCIDGKGAFEILKFAGKANKRLNMSHFTYSSDNSLFVITIYFK